MGNLFSVLLDGLLNGAFNNRRIRPRDVEGQSTDGELILYQCKYSAWTYLFGLCMVLSSVAAILGIVFMASGMLPAGIAMSAIGIPAAIFCGRRLRPVETHRPLIRLSPQGLTCWLDTGERTILWSQFAGAEARYAGQYAQYLSVALMPAEGHRKGETIIINKLCRYSYAQMAGLIHQYASRYRR